MIHFVIALLWRETRASWRRLLLFVLCIAAGVGGLVAVKSFSANVQGAIQREARSLMAADLSLHSYRPFTAAEEAQLARLHREGAEIARSYDFLSMARAAGSGRVVLASVRAVGRGYPFYGKVLTASGAPFREVLRDDTVLVERALLLRLGVKVGDTLEIGGRRFRIADVLVKEPDSPVQVFRLGPRVMMTEAAGEATGLITAQSRIRYGALVKLPAGADPYAVAADLRARLPDRFSSIRTYDEAQPRVSRFMGRLTDYLALTGLVALLLGGIGVSGAIRVFMAQKMDTLAILKCVGATSRMLLAVYLLQALLMGLLGSVIGLGLGFAAQAALPRLLGDLVPATLALRLPLSAALEGLALGGLTAVWFALPPLLVIRKVPPARVFRRQVEAPAAGQWAWWPAIASGAWGMLLVAALTVWETGTGKLALLFVGGLAATIALLALAAWGLLALLRRLPKPPRFEWRQGLSSLYRPGNQSGAVVVSLGLGVLLLLAVFLVQRDLLRQVDPLAIESVPNLFFIDIQPGQREAFADVLRQQGRQVPELVPVVRGRVVAVNGAPVRLDEIEDAHRRRHMRYEYAFTYRDRLVEGETVIAGTFGRDPNIEGPQVSVAQWWAEDTGVGLGDRVTVDIQGVRVTATVTSVRDIDWTARRANFAFVFLPGVLENAPKMYVTALRVETAAERAALQEAVSARLPNVTALDVEAVLSVVQQILNRIAVVIQFMAGFSIAVGLVILLAAVATTRYQRIREAVLLKTLGATRAAVARILALEYILLGGLAGAVGVLAAGAFSWGLVTWVFDSPWRFDLPPYALAWSAALLAVALAGLASSLDVLMKKPLEVLREE